jgi:hypothetical protein
MDGAAMVGAGIRSKQLGLDEMRDEGTRKRVSCTQLKAAAEKCRDMRHE